MEHRFCSILFVAGFLILVLTCEAKKSVVDMDEVELEKIYEEWDKNDADYDPEESEDNLYRKRMEEGKKYVPSADSLKDKDPQSLKYLSKKNAFLIIMAYFTKGLSKRKADELGRMWDIGLKNALLPVTYYPSDESMAIFYASDGSMAWEIKEYLINQRGLESVTIDGDTYKGLYPDIDEGEL